MRLGLNCPDYGVVLGVDYLPLDRDWQLVTDSTDWEDDFFYFDFPPHSESRNSRLDFWRRWRAWWLRRLRPLSACEREHVRVEALAMMMAAKALLTENHSLRGCSEFARWLWKLVQTLGTTD